MIHITFNNAPPYLPFQFFKIIQSLFRKGDETDFGELSSGKSFKKTKAASGRKSLQGIFFCGSSLLSDVWNRRSWL